ncbi:hypothetical protein ACFX1R_007693 [Malus domestica]
MFILSRANLGFFTVGSSIYRSHFNFPGVSGVEGFNAQISSLVDGWVKVVQSLLHLLYQRLRGNFWGRTLCLWLFSVHLLGTIGSHWYHLLAWRQLMATLGVADLVVQLEDSLDLAALDHGVKLVGKVPWAVMKKNFFVKKWLPDLAVEEVQLELVPFWVQIRGYGEWLKAPPIRDEVFIARPSVSGVGTRRLAGAVRGDASGIDRSRGSDSRLNQ